MISFKTYLSEATEEITFCFGRFQPPHMGHKKFLDNMSKVSKDYRIYTSQSNDPKKNPLDYKSKVKFLKELFPEHAKAVQYDTGVKDAIDVLVQLHKEGYTKVNFCVGSDRVKAFQFLKKYNGKEAGGKFYEFEQLEVMSVYERDPDFESDKGGESATSMRTAVKEGDFKTFKNGLPPKYRNGHELFNALRKGMGLEQVKNFREHVKLPKICDVREAYVKGTILNVGDEFVFGEGIEVVADRRPNFVVTESNKKIFVKDIEIEC